MKAVAWLTTLAIMWCINYFVLRIAGKCFNYTFTMNECNGIYLLLIWMRCIIGGGTND